MVEHATASRHRWTLLAVVFLAALAARGAAAWAFRDHPLRGDEIEYDALAGGLMETGRDARQPGFRLIAVACQGVYEGMARHGAPSTVGAVGLLVASSIALALVRN